MIPQLVQRIVAGVPALGIPGKSKEAAALQVLTADPLDLILHLEQLWNLSNPWAGQSASGRARTALSVTGEFAPYVPARLPAWDHFGYSYAIENTRAVQILRRVVREYRSGEGLGLPSVETQQWLDATETLLFGAANPIASWLSTSLVRPDAEAVRRNAYWRVFGLDLAFGDEKNGPPAYDRASASNTGFVRLFEELLLELWRAMTNERNIAGENASDDARIFRIAEELGYVLTSRRLQNNLTREEAGAAFALGWAELTVAFDTPIVKDIGAEATNAASRLQLIGQKVGLAAHSKSAAFFPLAAPLSKLLYTLEAGLVSGPEFAWVLYLETKPDPTALAEPIGAECRRVITEWAAATGKDLKARSRPVETGPARPRLVSVG